MKLTIVLEDEAWFWLYDEATTHWVAWYEEGDRPAERLEKMDRRTLVAVLALMENMAEAMESEILNAADASLNK